ncbi:MAG: hypothetical protein QTN59_18785 [Candidatus Electrothrix communis]|nr:MAG: hypothetical protein QTN59_18785 [Candidatus Electrothrix communis]
MEQIVVQVRDKEKAKMLLDLLTALDFVDSVQAGQSETSEQDTPGGFLFLGRNLEGQRYYPGVNS